MAGVGSVRDGADQPGGDAPAPEEAGAAARPGHGRDLSDVIDAVAATLDRELAAAAPDPDRRAWLIRQRQHLADASLSGRILRDPASAERSVARAVLARAAIRRPR